MGHDEGFFLEVTGQSNRVIQAARCRTVLVLQDLTAGRCLQIRDSRVACQSQHRKQAGCPAYKPIPQIAAEAALAAARSNQ